MQVRVDAEFNVLLSGVGPLGPDIAIGELVLEGNVRRCKVRDWKRNGNGNTNN